jgi:DNA-binding NarL/FixJ family response regulator
MDAARGAGTRRLTVVVVDDSPLIQRRLRAELATLPGVELVGVADDLASATAMIDARHPDIVVLDVELSHGDRGMSVLHHVTAHHAGTRVATLSNFGWTAMRDGFLKAGAAAYFDKAFEFGKLREWIASQVPPATRA